MITRSTASCVEVLAVLGLSVATACAQGDGDLRHPEDVRIVRVRVLADTTYRRIVDDWERRIRNAVSGASDCFERNFGIRFLVTDVQPLEYRGLTDEPSDRWKRLLRISPGEADLLLTFIGFGNYYRSGDDVQYLGDLGRGAPFGQHIMVSGEFSVHPIRDRVVLVHELAHTFGAFHVENKKSVMQTNYWNLPTKDLIRGRLFMDEPLKEIIRMTRDVDFRRGVDSLDAKTQRRVQTLCLEHRRADEKESPDPITLGRLYLVARGKMLAEAERTESEPP